jgi:hypothetical protein
MPSIAQRTVYVFAPDTIVFSYADSEKSQQKLRITDVPDSSVCLYFSAFNTVVKKCLPEGRDDLAYELRPGNRQQPGLWYRGTFTDAHAGEIKYHAVTLTTDSVVPVHAEIAEDTGKQEEVVSVYQALPEETHEVDSISEETAEFIEIISIEEEKVSVDIWETVKSAEFEFDRVRLFRDYFEKNGCKKEDVFRALNILQYDPSRLELLRSMVSFCKTSLHPYKQEIAETFFMYPHFRQQLLQLFTP